jgi:hypothetical protein
MYVRVRVVSCTPIKVYDLECLVNIAMVIGTVMNLQETVVILLKTLLIEKLTYVILCSIISILSLVVDIVSKVTSEATKRVFCGVRKLTASKEVS